HVDVQIQRVDLAGKLVCDLLRELRKRVRAKKELGEDRFPRLLRNGRDELAELRIAEVAVLDEILQVELEELTQREVVVERGACETHQVNEVSLLVLDFPVYCRNPPQVALGEPEDFRNAVL